MDEVFQGIYYRQCSNSQGFVHLKNVIDNDSALKLKREILELLNISNKSLEFLTQSSAYLIGSALDSFIHSEKIKGLAEQLLGGAASLYLPFTAVKGAGKGIFAFHQDNQYTPCDGPGVNIWFALMDISVEHGALRLVPESHKNGTLEAVDVHEGQFRGVAKDPDSWYDAKMNAGDCIAFDRLNLHGSGPNTTSEDRVGYALQYHRNDVKAYFDNQWELLTRRPKYPNNGVHSWAELAKKGPENEAH